MRRRDRRNNNGGGPSLDRLDQLSARYKQAQQQLANAEAELAAAEAEEKRVDALVGELFDQTISEDEFERRRAEATRRITAVRLRIAPVKALLATAHEEGLIRSNPAAGLRLGRTVANAPTKETHALTEEEVVRVLAAVPQEQRLLAEFLAQTGLRISEALALTKADIDFGKRRLSVSRRLYDGELDAPKSRHGVRQVPLSPELARRLWKQLATSDQGALVFAKADGSPLDRSKLYHVVKAAGERAGIAWPVGLHTFRHSCASIMFRRGVPKEAIRLLLGHHSWDFTAGTYVHLDDDDLPDGSIVGDLTAASAAISDVDGVTEVGR